MFTGGEVEERDFRLGVPGRSALGRVSRQRCVGYMWGRLKAGTVAGLRNCFGKKWKLRWANAKGKEWINFRRNHSWKPGRDDKQQAGWAKEEATAGRVSGAKEQVISRWHGTGSGIDAGEVSRGAGRTALRMCQARVWYEETGLRRADRRCTWWTEESNTMIVIMETVPKPWERPTFREVGSFARWGRLAIGCYDWGGKDATGT